MPARPLLGPSRPDPDFYHRHCCKRRSREVRLRCAGRLPRGAIPADSAPLFLAAAVTFQFLALAKSGSCQVFFASPFLGSALSAIMSPLPKLHLRALWVAPSAFFARLLNCFAFPRLQVWICSTVRNPHRSVPVCSGSTQQDIAHREPRSTSRSCTGTSVPTFQDTHGPPDSLLL
jgi:hypothetical protein